MPWGTGWTGPGLEQRAPSSPGEKAWDGVGGDGELKSSTGMGDRIALSFSVVRRGAGRGTLTTERLGLAKSFQTLWAKFKIYT